MRNRWLRSCSFVGLTYHFVTNVTTHFGQRKNKLWYFRLELLSTHAAPRIYCKYQLASKIQCTWSRSGPKCNVHDDTKVVSFQKCFNSEVAIRSMTFQLASVILASCTFIRNVCCVIIGWPVSFCHWRPSIVYWHRRYSMWQEFVDSCRISCTWWILFRFRCRWQLHGNYAT